jgi:eukaryotic-like serine/threonine-protein kinase
VSLGRLGRYEILERIGAGGVGVVFRARDTQLDRVVALKVLSEALATEPESRARLLREARAEAALCHPNIATCFDVGEAAPEPPDLLAPGAPGPHPTRVPYLAMEFVPGTDLLSLVSARPLPVARVVELAVQIAAGLEAAHAAGVVHRDLKPANVRVTPEGRVKVLDFGLARILAPPPAGATDGAWRTSEGRIMGTGPYMAPEQSHGGVVDERSDLFSFGVLLYQAVTAHLPFTGANLLEVFYSTAEEDPPPLARYAAGVPGELERIVRKLLAKRPAERYQSAHEVLTDLRALQQPGAARPPARPPLRPPLRARFAWLLAGAVVAAAALWWGAAHPPQAPSRNLAVLAFATPADSALEELAVGLAQELRSDLVQRTDLNVVSSAGVSGIRWQGRPPRAVGQELGVGSLLTGEVRREGSAVRLAVELVDARSGYVRWADRYDLTTLDALRVARELLGQVAAHLRAPLLAGTDEGAGTGRASAAGHDDYLRGVRALEDPDDPRAGERAADAFGTAIARAPDYALAWAGRTRALLRLYRADRREETLRGAEQSAARALELAPGLIEARVARSEVLRATGRADEAIAELKRVAAQRPNWDEACVQLAAAYREAGRLPDAERWLRRALEIRPGYWRNWNSLGALLTRRGDYAGARAAFRHIVALVPERNRGYEQLAALDMLEGHADSAIAEYRRLPTPVDDADLATNVGTACFYGGRFAEACEYYALAVRLRPTDPLLQRNLGDGCLRAGRTELARAAYREAVRLSAEELRLNPGNPELSVHHALYLAKAGDCDGAARALAALGEGPTAGAAELIYERAMAHSLCGRRAPALAALRRALALGVPAARPAADDEFRPLRDDDAFRRLLAARAVPAAARRGATASP